MKDLTTSLSCDLLSDLFFAIFKHNLNLFLNLNHVVVICFQICSLLYLNTTFNCFRLKLHCCDLLSDLFFAIFKHNKISRLFRLGHVVICFQICSLLYLNTTDQKIFATGGCCDLLSDLFFAIFKHNSISVNEFTTTVVICFQICSLLYLNTT